eukprot:7538920-Ditylum_brightwellii.AAC.1
MLETLLPVLSAPTPELQQAGVMWYHQKTETIQLDCGIDCNSEMCHWSAAKLNCLFLVVYERVVDHSPSGVSSLIGLLMRCDLDAAGAKAFLRKLRHRTQ